MMKEVNPNARRVIRANRLLAELGHSDSLEALEHMKRMRTALRIISTWAKFPPLDSGQVSRTCVDALKPTTTP